MRREGLIACPYFTLERLTAKCPFRVGAANRCRAIVCVKGSGELESRGRRFAFGTGDVLLLRPGPAQVHLAIVGAGGLIHAHAGLGRIVLTPPPLPWPIERHWRLRED